MTSSSDKLRETAELLRKEAQRQRQQRQVRSIKIARVLRSLGRLDDFMRRP